MDLSCTFAIGLLSLALLGACSSNGQRIDRQAHAAGLSRDVVTGAGYRHIVYGNLRDNRAAALTGPWSGRLVVFLDGDGRPWSADGQRPSSDPTTRNPVALQLLIRTPAPGIYISRPCYQRIADEKCSVQTWTNGRYADDIAASIAAVIDNIARSAGSSQIVLVGYSGGGALAVPVAERTANVAAVVTIAANLDTGAWTRHHGYLPLDRSLNPATGTHDHSWPEIHLQGGRDTVVPPATTAAYFIRYPIARQWKFDEYDHVCCWVDDWPELFPEILERVGIDHSSRRQRGVRKIGEHAIDAHVEKLAVLR